MCALPKSLNFCLKRTALLVLAASFVWCAIAALGNIPGGGTGTGPNVTLVDNVTNVTIANGYIGDVVHDGDVWAGARASAGNVAEGGDGQREARGKSEEGRGPEMNFA